MSDDKTTLVSVTQELAEVLAKWQAYVDKTKATGNLVELITAYQTLKDQYGPLDDARKQVYALLDSLEKGAVPEALENSGQDLVRIPSLRRSYYINQKLSASIIQERRLDAYDWLRKRNAGELISETINAGTLSSYLGSLIKDENIDPPEDLFKLNTYRTTGSSKYTPK